MQLKRMVVGVIALSGVLVACSADETDFKEAAEKAIRDGFEGSEVEDAECDDPESTDEGTEFACTATIDGTEMSFVAVIDGDDHVTVQAGG